MLDPPGEPRGHSVTAWPTHGSGRENPWRSWTHPLRCCSERSLNLTVVEVAEEWDWWGDQLEGRASIFKMCAANEENSLYL